MSNPNLCSWPRESRVPEDVGGRIGALVAAPTSPRKRTRLRQFDRIIGIRPWAGRNNPTDPECRPSPGERTGGKHFRRRGGSRIALYQERITSNCEISHGSGAKALDSNALFPAVTTAQAVIETGWCGAPFDFARGGQTSPGAKALITSAWMSVSMSLPSAS
jgi:hypothetical protein